MLGQLPLYRQHTIASPTVHITIQMKQFAETGGLQSVCS